MARPRIIDSPEEMVPCYDASLWTPCWRREKEIQQKIADEAHRVAGLVGLPGVIKVEQEKPLLHVPASTRGRIRMDVVLTHDDGSLTIIEVKRVRSVFELSMCVAQLLTYEQATIDTSGHDGGINLVAAVDGALYPTTLRMSARRGLGITFLHVCEDGFSLVELSE